MVYPPRIVPVAPKGKWKQELDRLQSLGIIEKVTKPTHGISSLVVVQEPQ